MRFCLLICLMLPIAGAHAALNKWIDAEGNIHYSDGPVPENARSQTLKLPPAASDVPAQKSLEEKLMDLKKKQQAESEAAQSEAQKQERATIIKDNCNKLRASLTTLERGGRIVSYDANGEPTYLEDENLQKRIDEVKARINKECE